MTTYTGPTAAGRGGVREPGRESVLECAIERELVDERDDQGDLPTALRAYERLIERGAGSSEAARAREAIQRIHDSRVHPADGRGDATRGRGVVA